MAHIFIGVGSSINRRENIRLGVQALQQTFGELNLSNVYESEAVGFEGGHFYNLVVELTSDLPIEEVIKQLKAIEIQLGRPLKAVKFAPRTLDLDLLLYDDVIDNSLDLPRAEITLNAFVLKPLAELAPRLLHPVLQLSYHTLWAQYPADKQKLWKVDSPVIAKSQSSS
ncbi:2-amino-4-hydroxy-6-hydroxymethyldihydropteridine diphosphokinase [Psychromonas sp. B3M02]|uniref:2-amino-4-hydroxy-6- hydroxymethyldihydropteridine diphosphokinase n=1 Tax=Psychromonas sp. B3M02 TaxID=2267226 RepID=UPI000DE84072|nr:2-amino-4-hydroxy-6-hydroxymethyldihydropteridine diphosphokinase [Psychromonas sp. B3M02]RBW42809.1 2-amino-4-hydroxy-6-hydroxymethyldihydropteridine diphosphokinase [Psychromonas sp. B3M02]